MKKKKTIEEVNRLIDMTVYTSQIKTVIEFMSNILITTGDEDRDSRHWAELTNMEDKLHELGKEVLKVIQQELK